MAEAFAMRSAALLLIVLHAAANVAVASLRCSAAATFAATLSAKAAASFDNSASQASSSISQAASASTSAFLRAACKASRSSLRAVCAESTVTCAVRSAAISFPSCSAAGSASFSSSSRASSSGLFPKPKDLVIFDHKDDAPAVMAPSSLVCDQLSADACVRNVHLPQMSVGSCDKVLVCTALVTKPGPLARRTTPRRATKTNSAKERSFEVAAVRPVQRIRIHATFPRAALPCPRDSVCSKRRQKDAVDQAWSIAAPTGQAVRKKAK
mmetsp:Transcript_30183/g.83003  ORF Transcript_30183/g.83003 Transcript_30183/m.83003 type:complete len:268 (-) Transcript_30183:38-841(-)